MTRSTEAQSLDTLFFTNQKIIGTVKEVTPETVSYSLPGKDVLFTLNKIDLIKICYADGKVTESPLINKEIIPYLENWNNVIISKELEDIHGLYKIGEMTMPGTASNDRGKAWLKLEAALVGGNIVHVDGSNQFASTRYISTPVYSKGKNTSYYSHPYTSFYSYTTASVYTSQPLDSAAFKKLTEQQPVLTLVYHFKHKGRSRLTSGDYSPSDSRIIRYELEDNNIFVWLNLTGYKTTKLHVNYFEKNRILLSYKNSWNGRYEVLLFLVKPASLMLSKRK
jgi:hypothetical protein